MLRLWRFEEENNLIRTFCFMLQKIESLASGNSCVFSISCISFLRVSTSKSVWNITRLRRGVLKFSNHIVVRVEKACFHLHQLNTCDWVVLVFISKFFLFYGPPRKTNDPFNDSLSLHAQPTERRDYCLNEISETEGKYVEALTMIKNVSIWLRDHNGIEIHLPCTLSRERF